MQTVSIRPGETKYLLSVAIQHVYCRTIFINELSIDELNVDLKRQKRAAKPYLF
jgi:hypothetical protein